MSRRDAGDRHRDRSRARAWVLQILYRWESEGARGPVRPALERTVETRRVAERRLPYVERVVDAYDEHRDEVDGALRGALDNWTMDRLAVIDRSVLRIAGSEMLFLDDIPPKVAVQEAIYLAERYGGEESARFVNGVLDGLLKAVRAGG